MIATYITNKTVSGNLLILKTFTLTAIPVRLLWVSLCQFTKHCIIFHWNRIWKNPTRFFSALYQDSVERLGLLKNKNHFELKIVKGDHNILVDGSQETCWFIRIDNYYLLLANFISFNLVCVYDMCDVILLYWRHPWRYTV